MKKSIAVITLCGIFILYTAACGRSDNSSTSSDAQSHNLKVETAEAEEDELMTNECLDGTDAEKIVDALVSEYQMKENNSGTESQINHSISYNGYNNEYNTYTLDYDITANSNHELEFATFTTYTGDLEYLTFCANLMSTDLISSDELTQWIRESTEDSDIQIGDGSFSLIHDSQNTEGSITLYVNGELE